MLGTTFSRARTSIPIDTPMPRLLYLHPGLVPPPADPSMDKFHYLSEVLEGDALMPVWWNTEDEARKGMGDRYPVSKVGRFRHHVYPGTSKEGLARMFANLRFFVKKGLELHRENNFDIIMTYGTNGTGIAGMILSFLTGAKLIPDLPNAPEHQYLFEEPTIPLSARIKKRLSDVLLHLVIWRSAMVKLLYPQQLRYYPLLRNKRSFVCHDFAATKYIANNAEVPPQRIVLMIGHPWFRKGFDIGILGFRKIAAQFPNHRLVIVGMNPDPTYLEQLAAGCDQIDIRRPVPGPEALKLIASCEVFLSASRSEGVARVLMEAMAARRPVVASAICGTPHLVEDNKSGLLFDSENVDQLASQLAKVLNNPELAARLGDAAHERIMNHFDECAYVDEFRRMIRTLYPAVPMNAQRVSGDGATS
jgi:glycosyltransferase involved in cell wall biosynthesis